ncbi:MAG: hypothetical protein ACE5F7_08090 [Nitrospiria bacterium]
MRATTLFFLIILFLNPSGLKAETLVEGVAAIITMNPDDVKRPPVREVLFISDLERYRLFFEPLREESVQTGRRDSDAGDKKKSAWMRRLDDVIGQKLLEPEAARFILTPPTEKEVEDYLLFIRQRFQSEDVFQNALRQSGLVIPELKAEIHRFLRVQTLIKERISEFIFINPKEVVAYYLEHLKDYLGRPFEDIEKDIERILAQKKERLRKTAYINRLKEKVRIERLLKKDRLEADLNGR